MDNTGVTSGTTTWTPIYDALVASLTPTAGSGHADTPRPHPQDPSDGEAVAVLTGPRLSESTARVVKAAEREAQDLGHDRLGAVHLVLGLLLVDGAEAARLRRAGFDLGTVRRYLEGAGHRATPGVERAGRGGPPTAVWTSAAAAALSSARARAGDDGRGEAGPGDLLDALMGQAGASAPSVGEAARLSA